MHPQFNTTFIRSNILFVLGLRETAGDVSTSAFKRTHGSLLYRLMCCRCVCFCSARNQIHAFIHPSAWRKPVCIGRAFNCYTWKPHSSDWNRGSTLYRQKMELWSTTFLLCAWVCVLLCLYANFVHYIVLVVQRYIQERAVHISGLKWDVCKWEIDQADSNINICDQRRNLNLI